MIAVIGVAVAVLATSRVKGVADGLGVLCAALASVAWRARRQHRRAASN